MKHRGKQGKSLGCKEPRYISITGFVYDLKLGLFTTKSLFYFIFLWTSFSRFPGVLGGIKWEHWPELGWLFHHQSFIKNFATCVRANNNRRVNIAWYIHIHSAKLKRKNMVQEYFTRFTQNSDISMNTYLNIKYFNVLENISSHTILLTRISTFLQLGLN